MKGLLGIAIVVLGFSGLAYADFHRTITNYENEPILVSAEASVGNVQFEDFCTNSSPDCSLLPGDSVHIIYETDSDESAEGGLTFSGQNYYATIYYSGKDVSTPRGGGLDMEESDGNLISDNHADVCIGLPSGQCNT